MKPEVNVIQAAPIFEADQVARFGKPYLQALYDRCVALSYREAALSKPVVFKPIVDLAKQFATRMRQQEKVLEADIGWLSSNPIREFDIFMVKYGQKPDSAWGIMRQLG